MTKQDNKICGLIKRVIIETLIDADLQSILETHFKQVNVDRINATTLEITVTPKQRKKLTSVLLEVKLEDI